MNKSILCFTTLLLLFSCTNSSTIANNENFEFTAVSTGWKEKILVKKNDGGVWYELPYSELQTVDSSAVDGSIIGWSNDKKYVWFYTNMDSGIIFYGRINAKLKKWENLGRPPKFASGEIEINLDNGDCLYTDYAFQFDTLQASQTKKENKTFHLYSYNFLTKENKLVETNNGEGFKIFKKQDGSLGFEKNNNY